MTVTKDALPANGVAITEMNAHLNLTNLKPEVITSLKPDFYLIDGHSSGRLISGTKQFDNQGNYSQNLQATFAPGKITVGILVNYQPAGKIQVNVVPDLSDTDSDGFPDVTELTSQSDIASFRKAFVAVSESQFHHPNDKWHEDQRDCAGFIRFAYREALKPHNDQWLSDLQISPLQPIGEIAKFQYPDVPLIKKLLFRKNGLSLADHSIDSLFSNFAQASILKDFNCIFLGRDRNIAESGDLIFFYHFDDQEMPYHGMIFIKDAFDAKNDIFIYHTGPNDKNDGEVRRVTREIFIRHPDKRWRPENSNPYFLGYYRWKILD